LAEDFVITVAKYVVLFLLPWSFFQHISSGSRSVFLAQGVLQLKLERAPKLDMQ